MTGLEPRDFTWVITDRLAVAERIGGHGFQHRRVRREEEIAWLLDKGITAILSLLEGNQNLTAYELAGLDTRHEPFVDGEPETVGASSSIATSSTTPWRDSWPATSCSAG
jgi:hypothetical protein